MTRTRTKAIAGLALLAGVLLITGIVWAKATTTTVPEVEITYVGTPDEETEIWVTDGGIQHIRRLPYVLTSKDEQPLEIAITGTCNHSRSLVTKDGNFWGDDTLVEVTWGELTGTFRGRHTGKTIDWVGYSNHVYHGVSGDFEGCKLTLNGTWDFTNKEGVLEGILQDPHGE